VAQRWLPHPAQRAARDLFEWESARSAPVLAALQAAGLWVLLTQGIGLPADTLGWILATRWAAKIRRAKPD
jgi:hypothetical protein